MATIAALALPATAAAEYFVPPSNSAATQYTETLPTAGGHRDAGEETKKGQRSPKDVLGARDVERLDKQGKEGREVAEFAAATAPTPETTETAPAEPEGDSGNDLGEKKQAERDGDGASAAAGKGGSPPPANPRAESPGPDGSSGIAEVISQATGSSSSGELGLLLPLAIVAAIAWALAFLWRQRNRSTA